MCSLTCHQHVWPCSLVNDQLRLGTPCRKGEGRRKDYYARGTRQTRNCRDSGFVQLAKVGKLSLSHSVDTQYNALYNRDNSTEGNCMSEMPLVCELTPTEITARRATLLPGLLAHAEERTPLADGLRWRFAASAVCLAAVAETIDAERQCCRFLRFVLTVEPGGGSLWREITGPQGTSEFLTSLLQGDSPQ